MNFVAITADDLKRKELNSLSKQMFYNYTIGEPFTDTKLMVTEGDVYKNRREYLPEPLLNRGDYAYIVAGVDWGDIHWATLQGVKTNGQIDVIRLFNVKKPGVTQANTAGEDVKSIIANLLPYSPDLIVADIGDSGDKINQLIDYFGPEVVYGCKYPTTPRSNGQLRASWNGSNNIVSADKLTYNKRYIAKLKQGLVGIYAREDQDFQYYVKHWKNVVIKDVEDERNPGMFYQTITRKSDD